MIALLCIFIVSFVFIQVPNTWLETAFFIRDAACTDLKTGMGMVSFVSLCTFVVVTSWVIGDWVRRRVGL